MPNSARDSSEWRDNFEAVLKSLRDWQDGGQDSPGEDLAQQFREKCSFYMELSILPPDFRLREMALGALLEYLGRSRCSAFAFIVQARPCPTFGRPVHLLGGPH